MISNIPNFSSVSIKCFTEADFDLNSKDRIRLQTIKVPLPGNEESRLQVLREASILDSDESDAIYDRFTNLAARIFKTPICLISLVDVDRQWFKSRVGLLASETIRDISFCTYVVLEESPDVMVVLDARNDDTPLVVGPPYIRFYAGAAIYLAGFKIGSFCIIDSEPKAAFSLNDQLNLMDISSMVSSIIEVRRRKNLDTENDNAKLSMNILYNLKCPLQICDKARHDVSVAYNNYRQINGDASFEEKGNNDVFPNITTAVNNLMSSIDQLKQLVESSIALAQTFVSYSANSEHLLEKSDIKPITNKFLEMEGFNILELFSQIRQDLNFNGAVDIKWKIEKRQFESADIHMSYPNIIKINFFSVFMNMLRESKDFTVRIHFREEESEIDEDDDFVDDDDDNVVQEWKRKGFSVMKGDLEILMSYSKNSQSKNSLPVDEKMKVMNYEQLDPNTINHLLKSIKGSYQVRTSKDVIPGQQEVKESTTISHILLFPTFLPYRTGKIKPKPIRNLPAVISSDISVTSNSKSSTNGHLRVLVIEDSITLQKLLKTWLTRNGCEVTICGNGRDGYEKITNEKFDMVLLDFLMPVMLGLTCLTNYNQWRKNQNLESDTTLIIGLSACATEKEQLEAFQLGMNFYCHKPTNTDILAIALAACRNNTTIDAICGEILKNTQNIKHGIRYPPKYLNDS